MPCSASEGQNSPERARWTPAPGGRGGSRGHSPSTLSALRTKAFRGLWRCAPRGEFWRAGLQASVCLASLGRGSVPRSRPAIVRRTPVTEVTTAEKATGGTANAVPPVWLEVKGLATSYFPALLYAVSSPRRPFTVVFGMGTGVASSPWSPVQKRLDNCTGTAGVRNGRASIAGHGGCGGLPCAGAAPSQVLRAVRCGVGLRLWRGVRAAALLSVILPRRCVPGGAQVSAAAEPRKPGGRLRCCFGKGRRPGRELPLRRRSGGRADAWPGTAPCWGSCLTLAAGIPRALSPVPECGPAAATPSVGTGRQGRNGGQASRLISTGWLKPLPVLHLLPIDPVVFRVP